jgi:hypothetical protein
MTDFGAYRDRSVKYGRSVRKFDRTATSGDMQQCADSHRDAYQDPSTPEWERPRRKAEAAYCQSLADRKAKQERST